MRGSIVERDGMFIAKGVFVISCGCGGVSSTAQQYLVRAGAGDVPVFESSGNKTVKGYMQQVGLKILIPSLKRPKHSILFNADNGLYLNLLGAKKNPMLMDNIRKVISDEV